MEWRLTEISQDDWIEFAIRAEFRVKVLAKLCCVSERSLERHFEDRFWVSPKHWLRKLRVFLSTQLIKRGECLKTVASELGFSNESHFIREFRFFFGCTPSDYRLTEAKRRHKRRADWPQEWRQLESEYGDRLLHPRYQVSLFPVALKL